MKSHKILVAIILSAVAFTSCRKDAPVAPVIPDPQPPVVIDPRDVYTGDYDFVVFIESWNIMSQTIAYDTSYYTGQIYPDTSTSDRIVIAYGAYQMDTVRVAPDSLGNFIIQTYGYYPGTIDTAGNVWFDYRASQSPSHYNDREVTGVRVN